MLLGRQLFGILRDKYFLVEGEGKFNLSELGVSVVKNRNKQNPYMQKESLTQGGAQYFPMWQMMVCKCLWLMLILVFLFVLFHHSSY